MAVESYLESKKNLPLDDLTDPKVLQFWFNKSIESERELRLAFEQLEKRFLELDPHNLYNSITEALITLDRDERILTFNHTAVRIFEIAESEAVGKSLRECLPVCMNAFGDYKKALSPDDRYEISFRNIKGDMVVLQTRFSGLMDRNGEMIGTTCLFRDLTVERLLEEKARRSDRLTALGELAAGVAHEMRNPLTTIRGYLQILPQFKDDDEFLQEFSDNLIREIDRLTRLTDDLLNMAKPISPERQPAQLSDLVQEVATFLSDKFNVARIQIIMAADREGTPVSIDRDRMKQVFINLFMNAIEAIGKDGRIEVRFSRRIEKLTKGEEPQKYAVAEVADNGPGIPEHYLNRLFDPFFTTKDSGTGLGLSLSNRIVEEHGGFLRVSSAPGEGTSFWIMLPLADV